MMRLTTGFETMSSTPLALLGDLLWYEDDPALGPDARRYIENGVLLIEDGHITAIGDAAVCQSLPTSTRIHDHRGSLITPGFVDTHVHYPQCEVVASYGTQLLEWLETYTFPAEAKFSDVDYATRVANVFLDELLRNGTTTALVFGTVHPQSVDVFFHLAEQRQLRMICGKVMMDRHAPENLRDTAEQGYTESLELLKRWHGRSRLHYAITPRFAPTSSDAQLKRAGELKAAYPDVYVHTHLAENTEECAWVRELFPERCDYVDVYDHFGLLGERSVFAHSIHLQDREWERLASSGSSIAHCPTSNLFIGSGLFNLEKARQSGIRTGIGTDIGGGDSFSLLRTLNEAYKVQQLQGVSLTSDQALYLATLGGARALRLDQYIGSFEKGNEADVVVLDVAATPLLKWRSEQCQTIDEKLFALMMLGDDRAISHTYILGEERKSAIHT